MSNKKEKKLLIEACEFAPQVTLSNELKESIKLAAGKNDTLIIRNVPCTILNRKNLNGRIYSTEVVQQAINEAREKIAQKQLLSQACEHPEGSFVSPTTASHVVIAAYIKKNTRIRVESEDIVQDVLFMDLEILNTQEGKNLRALIEGGCSVGTSIRGLGDLDDDRVVEYDLLGVDFVGNPSSSTFTNMPVNESVKVESADSRKLDEGFVVTTSSTNTVRDLAQAADISSKLDNIGYGTVAKTSTKVDEETNPKTGATTTLVTLEAETSDEVSDLNQALMMAKKAMLNPLVHVDSITIDNVEEEGDSRKEAVEEDVSVSYEVMVFAEDEFGRSREELESKEFENENDATDYAIDYMKNLDTAGKARVYKVYQEVDGAEKKYEVLKYVDNSGKVFVVENKEDAEYALLESADDKSGVKGRKFVLKTPNGYVAMNANAINFVKKPSEALQFIEGKEESGIVHLSNIEKILDTMGLYDVQKYYKKEGKRNSPEVTKKEEGLLAGDVVNGNDASSLPENNVLDGTPSKNIAGQPVVNMTEDTNKYTAIISSEEGQDTVPVTAVEYEGVVSEVSNLFNMKTRSLGPNITMMVRDNENGKNYRFDSEKGQLIITEADDANTNVNDSTVSMEIDDGITVEKEFDTPEQAAVAKAGIDAGKVDPTILVTEDNNEVYLVTDGTVLVYPNDGSLNKVDDELAFIDMEEFEDNVDIKPADYAWTSKEEAEEVAHDLNTTPGYENITFKVIVVDVPMDEKLYHEPDEASDPYVQTALKDANMNEAGEDDSVEVTIRDIDWNIDSFNEEDPSEIIDLLTKLPDEIRAVVHASDFDAAKNVKTAILAKVSEERDLPAINDATIDLAGLPSMPKE